MIKKYGFVKSCGITLWMFFTMFSIVGCASWWFVVLSALVLGPRELLTFEIMQWGVVSNFCLAGVCVGWSIFLLVKICKNRKFAKEFVE